MAINLLRTDKDGQIIVFWIAKDLRQGENYYKICTNVRNFWHLNKIHVHRDYVVKNIATISTDVSKKGARAIFIPESDLE